MRRFTGFLFAHTACVMSATAAATRGQWVAAGVWFVFFALFSYALISHVEGKK